MKSIETIESEIKILVREIIAIRSRIEQLTTEDKNHFELSECNRNLNALYECKANLWAEKEARFKIENGCLFELQETPNGIDYVSVASLLNGLDQYPLASIHWYRSNR